jgi:hypothetical protein
VFFPLKKLIELIVVEVSIAVFIIFLSASAICIILIIEHSISRMTSCSKKIN